MSRPYIQNKYQRKKNTSCANCANPTSPSIMDYHSRVPNPMSHENISTPRPAKPEDSPPYLRVVKTSVAKRTVVYTKTNEPNLWRHKNGTYYARLILDGKRQFRSLHTDLKSVAVVELKKQEELAAKQRSVSVNSGGPRPRTFHDCIELYRARLGNDVTHSILKEFTHTKRPFIFMD